MGSGEQRLSPFPSKHLNHVLVMARNLGDVTLLINVVAETKGSTWPCPWDKAAIEEQKSLRPLRTEVRSFTLQPCFSLGIRVKGWEQVSCGLTSSIRNWCHLSWWESLLANTPFGPITEFDQRYWLLVEQPKDSTNISSWGIWCWGVEIDVTSSVTEDKKGGGKKLQSLKSKRLRIFFRQEKACLNNFFSNSLIKKGW